MHCRKARLGVAAYLLLSLSVAAGTFAFSPAAGAPVAQPAPLLSYNVSGWITDSLTFAPVPNVTVSSNTGAMTRTAGTGFYSLSVPRGSNTLTLTAVGYHPTTFTLNVNSNIANQNRTLRPYTYAITGAVVDKNTNLGIGGAVVLLLPVGLSNRTSATGAFRILCENGSYTLQAGAPGYGSGEVNLTVAGQPITQYFLLDAASGASSAPSAIVIAGLAATIGVAIGVITYLAVALREGELLRRRPQPLAGIAANRLSARPRHESNHEESLSERRRRRGT
jgi:carboxypeptidase family protein